MDRLLILATADHAKKLLQEQPDQYKQVWREMDRLRYANGNRSWPDWCFVPQSLLNGSFETTTASTDGQFVVALSVARALGTWRVTQGVYSFDGDVFEHVTNTEQAGPLPVEILLQLPEWCIYVSTPSATFRGDSQFGFFATLDWDSQRSNPTLEIFVFSESAIEGLRLPLLRGASLDDCIEKSVTFAMEGPLAPTMDEIRKLDGERADFMRMLNLLLFICSQAGEVGEGRAIELPMPTKTKKGIRHFPPTKVSVWDVGSRIGAKLRTALSVASDSMTATGETGCTKRPHIRRAHWHGYWLGPRDSEQRTFDLRWMPPIAVNVEDVENLRATVRKVSV
jgi:hypothetical protein